MRTPPLDPALLLTALDGPRRVTTAEELDALAAARARLGPHAAAIDAARLLDEGRVHIRVVTAHALGVFLEGGPGSLPSLCRVLAAALATRWSKIEPRTRHAHAVDDALDALFSDMVHLMLHHERVRSLIWFAWRHGATPEAIASLRPALDELASTLRGRLDAPCSLEALARAGEAACRYEPATHRETRRGA